MSEENISQELILGNIVKTRSYLIKEINQNKLMSKKYEKDCRVWSHIEYLLMLIFAVTGYVSISAFASLVGILVGIMSSAIELKICVIISGIKYKFIIKKKKKRYDKKVLWTKSKVNKVLISKALTDSNITHDEFVLINNVLKEVYDMKGEVKNSNDK